MSFVCFLVVVLVVQVVSSTPRMRTAPLTSISKAFSKSAAMISLSVLCCNNCPLPPTAMAAGLERIAEFKPLVSDMDYQRLSPDEKIGYLYGSILNIRGDIGKLNIAGIFMIAGLFYVVIETRENRRISQESMDKMAKVIRENRIEDQAEVKENRRITQEAMDKMAELASRNRIEDQAKADKNRLDDKASMEASKREARISTFATLFIAIAGAVVAVYSATNK